MRRLLLVLFATSGLFLGSAKDDRAEDKLRTVPQRAKELGIGDAAPKLTVQEFVKGDSVARFEKGKVYVVEFWATWCGPCVKFIPHLTELQKKYKDVVFIGVSVFEQDQRNVQPFVKKMGAKMGYRVATDAANAMGKNWLLAAGWAGIPRAFIVDGNGKIAWIGHPVKMEEPLAKIRSGRWDLQAAAAEYAAFKKEQSGLNKLPQAVVAAVKKRFPQAELVRASDDESELVVILKDGGKIIEVTLTPQGVITLIEKHISFADLPETVQSTLRKTYPGVHWLKVEETIRVQDGKETLDFYEMGLKIAKGKPFEAKVGADGKIQGKEGERARKEVERLAEEARRQAAQAPEAERDTVKTVVELGGEMVRDNQAEGRPVIGVDWHGAPVTDVELKVLKRLKKLKTLLLIQTGVTDAGLKELQELKELRELRLDGTQVTDAGLKELQGLKELRRLGLSGGMQVTDMGLKELQELKELRELRLGGAQVTDAGLKELQGLKQLQTLGLGGTPVTDAGLKELQGMKNLRMLRLTSTQVTDAGVADLQKALPKLQIQR